MDEEDAELELDDGSADTAREAKMMQVLTAMNENLGSVLKQRYSKSGGASSGGGAGSNVTYLDVPGVEYTHPLNGPHNVVESLQENSQMLNYGGYSGEAVFISPFEQINDVNMVAGRSNISVSCPGCSLAPPNIQFVHFAPTYQDCGKRPWTNWQYTIGAPPYCIVIRPFPDLLMACYPDPLNRQIWTHNFEENQYWLNFGERLLE